MSKQALIRVRNLKKSFPRERVKAPLWAKAVGKAWGWTGQLDEWDRMRESLPSLDARVVLNVDTGRLPNVVHPLTQEVLLLLEIYELVRDVVDHCSHPDYQVLRTLHTLVDRKIVRLTRDSSSAPAGDGDLLFSPAQVRRLQDWLQSGRSGGTRSRVAKLLLVASDVSATRSFVRR